jgi:diguanylate cyclase (GGDEF)-like protein
MAVQRKGAKRLALLCNEVGSLYQAHLWNSFISATAHFGNGAVGVFGRTWGSPVDNEAVANEAYRFLNALGVQSAVVPGALLSTHKPITGLQEAAGLDDIRSVYLGARVHAGQRLVQIDPVPGIRAGLEHLVQVHGCRKIGCVTGAASNPETGERLQAYRQSLQDLSLPWDPSLEEPGDFNTEGGGMAALALLRRHSDLQAIFFMSDNMAIGAQRALREAGYAAADTPRFLGFDDIEEASFCERPLTTIRQPSHQMVWRAVERLQGAVPGTVGEVEQLPAELVVRRSCGCHLAEIPDPEQQNQLLSANLDFLFQSRRVRRAAQALFADMEPGNWDQRLGTALERMDIPWAGFLEWKTTDPLPKVELSDVEFHRWVEFRAGQAKPSIVEAVSGNHLRKVLDQRKTPVLVFPMVCENHFLGLCLLQHVSGLELTYDPFLLQLAAALRGTWLLEAHKLAGQKLLRLNKRLQDQSHRDELTGILNRRGFYMLAEQALLDFSRAREDSLAALIFVDMDGLKGINDTLGHAEGDHAIRNMAIALQDTLRKNDIFARMGGDEFVVFARIKKTEEADTLMQRALYHLRELDGGDCSLSFSYGVHLVRARDPLNLNGLLVQADALLYEAKQRRKESKAKEHQPLKQKSSKA